MERPHASTATPPWPLTARPLLFSQAGALGRVASTGKSQASRAPLPRAISPASREVAQSASTVTLRRRSACARRFCSAGGQPWASGAPPVTSVTADPGSRWRMASASSMARPPLAPASANARVDWPPAPPITATRKALAAASSGTRGHRAAKASSGRTNRPCLRAPGKVRSRASRSCTGSWHTLSQSKFSTVPSASSSALACALSSTSRVASQRAPLCCTRGSSGVMQSASACWPATKPASMPASIHCGCGVTRITFTPGNGCWRMRASRCRCANPPPSSTSWAVMAAGRRRQHSSGWCRRCCRNRPPAR